jgi:glycosyl transferase family 87
MNAKWFAERYLRPKIARFASASVLMIVAVLTVAMFAAELRGQPGRLPPLGEDYASFYMIGTLQEECGVERLYDLKLQDRILHRIAPRIPSGESLPFVYPPFLAPAFRPLARIPYAGSFAAWIVITASLYAASLAAVLWDCPAIPRSDRITACLLAASFEPFAMECVLGG